MGEKLWKHYVEDKAMTDQAACGCTCHISGADLMKHMDGYCSCKSSDSKAPCFCGGSDATGHNPTMGHTEHKPSDPTAKAREIRKVLLGAQAIPSEKNDIDYITAALEAERKAGREEGKLFIHVDDPMMQEKFNSAVEKIRAEGYRRGLEEAAEMVLACEIPITNDEFEGKTEVGVFDLLERIAERIRRLALAKENNK